MWSILAPVLAPPPTLPSFDAPRVPSGTEAASPGQITLLRDGAEAFPSFLDAIASAQLEICAEFYWWASDPVGRRFVEALVARARDGVRVRVIFDAVGSWGTDRAMFDPLIEAGGAVLEYHPVQPWRRRFSFGTVSQRDHRKILVVDGQVGFTGGINLCEEAAPVSEGGKGWRDMAVRVTGPAVSALRVLFFESWKRGGGVPLRDDLPGLPLPRRIPRRAVVAQVRDDVRRQGIREPRGLGEVLREQALGPRTHAPGAPRFSARPPDPAVHVLGHVPRAAGRSVRRMYVYRIAAAKRVVLLENPYFVPDPVVRRALERAARRGVEVRVVLPRENDVAAVAHAGRAQYARLLRAGVHVHEWLPSVLHAKCAVIDGWATVGSYNFDYRSFRFNLEANAASEDPAFVQSLEACLRDDLAHCDEIDRAAWSRRPLSQRAREWFYYFLRKLL